MIYKKNEKGVTLIEVLAAIVILSIIIGVIIKFFPQMSLINNANGEKSQAINTAKQELNKWKSDDNVKGFLEASGSGTWTLPGTQFFPNYQSSNGQTYYKFQSKDGNCIILIKQNPDVLIDSTDPNPNKAYMITVQPLNAKGAKITQTYGYIFSK